jgi:hypothetical protein
MLPINQKIFFYVVALVIFVLILNLVRKRKLRENYALLWIFISLSLVFIVLTYSWLILVSNWLSALPTSVLMFCGMIALLLLILQLCIMNTYQANQIKNLVQKIAIFEQKLTKIESKKTKIRKKN